MASEIGPLINKRMPTEREEAMFYDWPFKITYMCSG
jgi:hypothetical protein